MRGALLVLDRGRRELELRKELHKLIDLVIEKVEEGKKKPDGFI